MNINYLLSESDPTVSVSAVAKLGAQPLAEYIVSDVLNRLIRDRDAGGIFGKGVNHLIPYAGWGWRDVDFFGEHGADIAFDGSRTVICENNKWDYPSRSLSDAERAEFLHLVWCAYRESMCGGVLSDIHEKTDKALSHAGAFILSLTVDREANS